MEFRNALLLSLEQAEEKLAMNENESEGLKKKKKSVQTLKCPCWLLVSVKCCLKCELKLAWWLSLRTLVLAFWHRAGVSYFDKCRSTRRIASIPLQSWIKGVASFQ